MTTFADGVSQFGGMPIMGGLPPLMSASSKAFFVDPVNGSDGNSGTSPGRAFASLYRAHYMMTSANSYVSNLYGTGTSGLDVAPS